MSYVPQALYIYYIIIDFWVVIYPAAFMMILLKPVLKSLEEEFRSVEEEYEKTYREFEEAVAK